VNTTHELEQQPFLDDVVPIYSGCDTVNEASVDIVGVNHRLELVKFLLCQRIGKGFSLVILFLISADISATDLQAEK